MRIALFSLCAVLALAACDDSKKKSVELNNEGAKALGQKQYETAINHYQESTEAWADNHMSWYGMGQAYFQRQKFKDAADAFTKAVKLNDGDAMYHQFLGLALYEQAIQQAREEQARRENKKPEEVEPDLRTVNFEPAIQHLTAAVKINGDLWRSHLYLGRIYRAQDKAKEAAEEFTRAIQTNPREQGAYVALVELYRLWDYTDQAIQVATAGTQYVPGQLERSEVWFVLGMAQSRKKNLDEAIKAFTHAVEDRKDNQKAKFQRGKAFFEKGDFAKAKKDLEEFNKSAGTGEGLNKSVANQMLMDIAAQQI